MPVAATFESFEKELNRLVESFGKRLADLKSSDYNEAKLRDDFLNPFFAALGWDMPNTQGLIQREREVEIESPTRIGGGRKRADYLFRTDKRDRFVCEAKKPAEELHAKYAFQAKRYAWNKGVPVALLTDFEELKIYVVGGKPHIEEPQVGEWKSWHFQQYPLLARELWDLLARDKIAAGSIDAALEALPKKASGKGKARQQWLIKPDRTRALDTDFLEFLDHNRRALASDIYKNNDHAELLAGDKLTEACQRIIDRILFLRICEDRDINTGELLQSIVEKWRKSTGNDDTGRRARQPAFDSLREEPPAYHAGADVRAPKDSLWSALVSHFRGLARRPPTHVPFFNGSLFTPHFTETLVIGDEWLAGFIGELSADESPYLFSAMPVEILGSVYERFLGKVVRPHGKGITVEEKPEVRKAGGVYYTPRYIVDYIVEQTAGKLLDEIAAEKETEGVKAFAMRTEKLRLLDPACGSGSFLIRAFERVCEHWQKRLTADLRAALDQDAMVGRGVLTAPPTANEPVPTQPGGALGQTPPTSNRAARAAWEKKHRPLCWVDAETGDVHLTVALKRQILTQNIYGVDLDAAAVEVTQLSLYLKMLEGENRTTLQRQRELLADETEIALLPPLQDNIKCFNSLIGSDFSMMPEDLLRVNAKDWKYQFAAIMKGGGFDAVIGNPPYALIGSDQPLEQEYFTSGRFSLTAYKINLYLLFVERALSLLKSPTGILGYIIPKSLVFNSFFENTRRQLLRNYSLPLVVEIRDRVFADAEVGDSLLLFAEKRIPTPDTKLLYRAVQNIWPNETLVEQSLCKQTDLAALEGAYFKPAGLRISKTKYVLADGWKVSNGLNPGNIRHILLSDSKKTAKHRRMLLGRDLQRYDIIWSGTWVNYDPTLKDRLKPADTKSKKGMTAQGKVDFALRSPDIYKASNVMVRKTADRIIACYDEEGFCFDSLSYGIQPIKPGIHPKFLLGLLNSSLLNRIHDGFSQNKEKVFAKVLAENLNRLPMPDIDLKKPADKSRHDQLVLLVDKLLGLMPKLRAATAESEKAVLENAVTATDQQIDQLVYELYQLTPAEIALVEGAR